MLPDLCVVLVGSAMEVFQQVGTRIHTAASMVATRMGASTRWQCGGGRVTGAFGGAANAWHAIGGDVS